MAHVFIPAQLRDVTEGLAEVDVEGHDVGHVIAGLESRFPGFKNRICENNQLLPGLQVAVDQVSTRSLTVPVQPESEVHFLPAIGGG